MQMISVSPAQLSPPHALETPRLRAVQVPDTAGGFAPCPSMWGSSRAAHLHETTYGIVQRDLGEGPLLGCDATSPTQQA